MELRQIRYFLAVARAGSITTAAEHLHMTQPPLSLAITRLEKEVGARLFIRTPKGVSLTEAGRFLVEAGQRLVADEERLGENLRLVAGGLVGELRISAGPLIYWDYLGPVLARFTTEVAGVSLVLGDPAPGQLLDEMARGLVDVGLVASADPDHFRHTHAGELQVRTVGQIPLRLGVPHDWPELPDPVDLAEIADRLWIIPARVPQFDGIPEIIERSFTAAGVPLPRSIEVPTPQTALPLVAAGMGVAVLGQHAAEHLTRVRIHDVHGGLAPLHVVAVWPAGRPLSPVTRRFVRTLGGD